MKTCKIMKRICFPICALLLCLQACNSVIDDTDIQTDEINVTHFLLSAGLPSDKDPGSKVILEGDTPSSPIILKWQGSTSDFREQFAIIGYDSDGNIAHVTDASRLAEETEDSTTGTFDFSFDTAYWIDDLEYRSFYALYPYRPYDAIYLSGNDNDKDNWVFKFAEQTGHFEDITQNLFMTSDRIDLEEPDIQFQYGIAILRLSGLTVPEMAGQTISNIKIKSNAIKDAISYRYTISDYYAAGNEITISGEYPVNADGLVEENLYAVFFPTSNTIDYLSLTLTIEGTNYSYAYDGNLEKFVAGKVYSLKNAVLEKKNKTPDYGWYLNPVGQDSYLISNAREFLGFARIVNGETDALSVVGRDAADQFESKVIALQDNATIDLSDVLDVGESWIPIKGFKGNLKGNGATISNLYIGGNFSNYSPKQIGLFGSIESASISSLTVTGIIDGNGCFNGYIGGLTGDAVESCFVNCTTEIQINHTGGYGNHIGGLAGRLVKQNYPTNSNVVGCLDKSAITISTMSRDTDYVGGIVGRTAGSDSYIIACSHQENTLSVNSNSFVGGIVGIESNSSLATISGCYKSGTISGSYGGHIHGGCYRGTTSSSLRVSSCYYSGTGSSYIYAGIGNYGGNPFNYGTQSVGNEQSMLSACEDMNAVIAEWNTNHPDLVCNRQYSVRDNQIVFE